jgi:hypothetical protein
MIIQFGEWLPDQPRFGNPCITATNVIPTENGYGPFPSATSVSDALADECKGVISFRRVDGQREVFAGTATNLYRKNGNLWTDVTPTAGYSNTVTWRFAVYGERLVATNGIDNPQKFDLATDSEFSDLTNAPAHKYPIVVGDVLVALGLTDGSGNEVAFSAVNNSESWTTATGGGAQSIADGGPVAGGVGGEVGIILQESQVLLMNFVGGDLRFTFERVEGAIGCIDASSIVSYKGGVFYLSSEGFQFFDRVSSNNISSGKVTDYFFDNFAVTERIAPLSTTTYTRITSEGDTRVVNLGDSVQGALDPVNSCVLWSYPAETGTMIIGYNYRLGRWFESDAAVYMLHTHITPSGYLLAGFNASDNLANFSGTPLTAVLSTGDLAITPGRSSFIDSVYGIVDSAHDITIGKKVDMADTESTTSGSSNSRGKVSIRSNGKYHRIQISPTAAFTEITGAQVEVRGGSKV